jgi:hypothetical protein
MKRANILEALFILVLTIVFAVPSVLAQKSGHGKFMPRYDPTTEVTIMGTVEEVKEHPGHMGWIGTHLIVKAGSDTIDVHLGPSAFLAEHKMAFAKGDHVEVMGSRQKIEGVDSMIARKVTKGDQTLILRSPNGIPMWREVPNP